MYLVMLVCSSGLLETNWPTGFQQALTLESYFSLSNKVFPPLQVVLLLTMLISVPVSLVLPLIFKQVVWGQG